MDNPNIECQPSENGRNCITHHWLPLYPTEPKSKCIDGLAQKAIREPKCHCTNSTLWIERRYDGIFKFEDKFIKNLEQRTCLACGASLSREVPKE